MTHPNTPSLPPEPPFDLAGLTAFEIIGEVKKTLRDRDAAVRVRTIDWLSERIEDPGDLMPSGYMRAMTRPLIRAAAADEHPNVRKRALAVLPLLSPVHETVEILLGSVKDPDPGVRSAALTTLLMLPSFDWGAVQFSPSDAAMVLIEAAKDLAPTVSRPAIEALRLTTCAAASAGVPALIGALRNSTAEVRAEALATLTWLGPEAVVAVPTLVDFLSSEPENRISGAAVRALCAIDPEHEISLPRLKAIEGDSTRVRLAEVLARGGAAARSLRLALQACWVKGSESIRLDGPEAPSSFWYHGERLDMPPIACRLLLCLWGKDSVPIDQVARPVWNSRRCSVKQLADALTKLNGFLKKRAAGLHLRYGRKKDHIQQLSKVAKRSPEGPQTGGR